jgi:hypothetical protein
VSTQAPAVAGIGIVAIDCADPPRLAEFWAALVGGQIELDGDGDARLRPPGGPVLDFLRVPETKSLKNRLHLDLHTTDLAAATGQALAFGATKADDLYVGRGWQVLRDPEGNEFCLLMPQPLP